MEKKPETYKTSVSQSEGPNSEKIDKSKDGAIFLDSKVRKSKDHTLKIRLGTLIRAKGMSEPDFYNSLGFSKQVWYCLSWGIWEPTIKQKVRIAQALGIDSSVIWEGING